VEGVCQGVNLAKVLTATAEVTACTYDAANCLTSVEGVSYTEVERENLTSECVNHCETTQSRIQGAQCKIKMSSALGLRS
jgi:hypothetical protein